MTTMISTSALETRKVLIKTTLPLSSSLYCTHTFEDLKSSLPYLDLCNQLQFRDLPKQVLIKCLIFGFVFHIKYESLSGSNNLNENLSVLQFPLTGPCFISPPSLCQSRSLCWALGSPGFTFSVTSELLCR